MQPDYYYIYELYSRSEDAARDKYEILAESECDRRSSRKSEKDAREAPGSDR